jgi:hypothetical protein
LAGFAEGDLFDDGFGELFTTQVPPRTMPESRHFGGILGGIRRHMEAAAPYPDTLSGLLSGFPLSHWRHGVDCM